MERTSKAQWKGSIKEGKGTVTAPSGVLSNSPYSYLTRFENTPGTNPEELIGAAHAGWRGTAAGIAGKTARVMQEVYGCRGEDIRAAVGPAIGQCCFKTDGDVPEALRAALGHEAEPYMVWNGSKWHIDLKAVNALWLRREGVTCIDICDHCTACRPDLYWSHRKMGLRRGEQAALIALREDTL